MHTRALLALRAERVDPVQAESRVKIDARRRSRTRTC